jgi:transcriptional regulator GlxA family with amidase domain
MRTSAEASASSWPDPLPIVLVALPSSEALDVVGTLDILFLANNALKASGGRPWDTSPGRSSMSGRNFFRAFAHDIGTTPARFV